MNTPAHLLLWATVMGRKGEARVIWAAVLGALLPDLSLYVMAGASLYLLNIPAQIVFDQLYFSNTWQTVFAIDNSFVIWGLVLGLAIWSGRTWAIALAGAALLHLALDFPLHHDDGRPHFWPFSNWVFESPVSYWDIRQGAGWVAPIEAAVAVSGAILLWRHRLGWGISAGVALLLLAELMVARVWMFVFVT